MASTEFEAELSKTRQKLLLQIPNKNNLSLPTKSSVALRYFNLSMPRQLENYSDSRIEDLKNKIHAVHANLKNLSLIEAKSYYIKFYSSLENYATTAFLVEQLAPSSKPEVVSAKSSSIEMVPSEGNIFVHNCDGRAKNLFTPSNNSKIAPKIMKISTDGIKICSVTAVTEISVSFNEIEEYSVNKEQQVVDFKMVSGRLLKLRAINCCVSVIGEFIGGCIYQNLKLKDPNSASLETYRRLMNA